MTGSPRVVLDTSSPGTNKMDLYVGPLHVANLYSTVSTNPLGGQESRDLRKPKPQTYITPQIEKLVLRGQQTGAFIAAPSTTRTTNAEEGPVSDNPTLAIQRIVDIVGKTIVRVEQFEAFAGEGSERGSRLYFSDGSSFTLLH